MKYTRDDLIRIYNLTLMQKVDEAYPELERIQSKLYIILDTFDNINNDIKNNLNYYIEKTIDLLLNSPYKEYMSHDMLELLTFNIEYPYEFFDKVDALFNKEKLNNQLSLYMYNMNEIFDYVFWQDINCNNYHNFRYPWLNNVCDLIRNYKANGEHFIPRTWSITKYLLSYIHYYNIDNFDLLYRFLEDKSYYIEKCNLYGVNTKTLKSKDLYNKEYEEIFALIPLVFCEKREIGR